MPEIPFMQNGKRINPTGEGIVLQAIMNSPTDIDSGVDFCKIASFCSSKLARNTLSQFMKKATAGTIAGDVFHTLLRLKVHHPADASIAKSSFLVSRDLEGQFLRASGKILSSNIDRVHKTWAEYRPAAHLWAAYQIGLHPVPKTPSYTNPQIE